MYLRLLSRCFMQNNWQTCIRFGLASSLLYSLSINSIAADLSSQSISSDKTLTLNQAVKQTLRQHPSLQIFPLKQKQLNAQRQTAELNPATEVNVKTENFLGTGKNRLLKSAELTLTLSSVIELGDKRQARINQVNSSVDESNIAQQVSSLNLIAQVTQHYVETLAAQAYVKLAQQSVDLAKIVVDKVNKRATAGGAPEAEVNLAKANLLTAELTLTQNQQDFEFNKTMLSLFWNTQLVHKPAGFKSLSGDLFNFGEAISFNQLFERLKSNPQVQMQMAQQRSKLAEINLAKSQSTADLSWSLGVKYDNEANESALVASANMPLYQQKRNQGQVKALSAQREQILIEQKNTLLDLQRQLYQAFSLRSQSISAVDTLKNKVIPLLKQSLSQTEAAYLAGRYPYSEWESAYTSLLQAQTSLIDHAQIALKQTAQIERVSALNLMKPANSTAALKDY
ncbi:TolC family protein [Catenovulum adriaticum]|uniref:TolC family protein n=1 Tax=Catenovulum adriaticum TaxID=2984846 RepID=A0ABY7APP2_9ALTE|nr:TolC family protein [Catenovulum sp. TS8]WAJ71542.1 TolC family protein [Catenovulum sp. TS8]